MDWKPLAAFVTAVVLGGVNFVGVRYSNEELEPIWGAALRFGLAAAIFACARPSRREHGAVVNDSRADTIVM